MNDQKSSEMALDRALTLTVVGMQTKFVQPTSAIGVLECYLTIFRGLKKEFETPAAEA